MKLPARKSVLFGTAAFAVALALAVISPLASVAQDESGLHSVTFDGHTLDFPAELTHAVSIVVYDEPVPNENGLEQAPRIQIRIGGGEISTMPFGAVDIYRLDEVEGFQAEESFSRLAEILDERPDLGEYLAENQMLPTAFPFLETTHPVNTFSTRAAYFESENYAGIVSINARIYHLASGAVFMRYNLEAISDDGVWGISAHFDLQGEYPETLDTLQDEELYAGEVMAFLLDTPAHEFQPSLDLLDQLFDSIRHTQE